MQTKGSITSGNITLKNTALDNSPGLSLQSGLSDSQSSTDTGYSVTDLTTLLGGYATAINNSGQIVGNFTSSGHPFLYSNGQMIDLGTMIDLSTFSQSFYHPTAINDSAQITGYYTNIYANNNYTFNAFLYSDGKTTDLGSLGGTHTVPASINSSGQVIGVSTTDINRSIYHTLDGSTYNGFLYSDGQMTSLGTLPVGTHSTATAVNDSGQIVGSANTADFIDAIDGMTGKAYSSEPGFVESDRGFNPEDHAFLYSNGQMTDLGTLGASSSTATAINDSGQIVGFLNNASNAFLYTNGKMTDLNSLIPQDSGWTLSEATAINNKGQILGYGNISGQYRQFLLNPISTTATPKDGITVGNISTQGSSVLLQGLKINLTGSKVVTKGGNITFDGPTILNSSTGAYTFNSAKSSATSKGGDITFKNTLDSNSAGASSLSLTAGLGNITFNNAVGGNASLKDLTVNSAKTFTALGDITTQGNININAIDDITTASLSTTDSGNVNIFLGKIGDKKYDSKGNVTTGNITAKQVDILSDGAFRTHSDIQTKDGDVNITALKDIVVNNITSTNAGISLISGTDAITATGEIIGDYGVTALAKQNITTEKIQSANDVVLLNSSQGAVTVNGAITSSSDVSLGAFKDVVTQDITSLDGAVALISSSGNVNAQGAIASVDNVTLGASGNVVAQNITSTYGTVALVSNSGAVSASQINGGADVVISAKQNINTPKINSWEGTVTLTTKQGTVSTTGDITTNNGDVYISSAGDVVSQNIISNGGAITVVSSAGSLKTGYLRSDGQGTGGKIYLRAADLIRVTSSVNINGTNYSIYTGTNKKDWVKVIYGNGNSKSNKSNIAFLIGDASTNGTAARVELETSVTILKPAPVPPRVGSGWLLIPRVIEEIFRSILDAGSTAPGYVDEINPITGGRYRDQQEYKLVNQQLTPNQRDEIKRLVNNPNYGLTMKYVEQNGRFSKEELNDNHRCYGFLLPIHLGRNINNHHGYATDVTGSKGDFVMIPPNGVVTADPLSQIYRVAFYDGIVVPDGASEKPPLATLINPPQKVGDVAEVKTGYQFLERIEQHNPLPEKEINGQTVPSDQERYDDLVKQVLKEAVIAKACHKEYFLAFNIEDVANSARRLLNSDPSILAAGLSIIVRYIEQR